MRAVRPDVYFPGLRLLAQRRLSGAPTEFEMGVLSEICRLRRPEKVLDIGTGMGATAAMFARLGAQVTTIGICDADISNVTMGLPEHEHIYVPDTETWSFTVERLETLGVRVIQADSATFDFGTLPLFDMIFVDGCHSGAYVRNDSEKAMTRLNEGGLMAWHDYQPIPQSMWPDVRDYLDELATRLPLVYLELTTMVVYKKEG